MKPTPCEAFRWIGQPLTTCDGCGHPFWEHTHEQRLRNGRWFHKIISAELKAQVKKKWERPAPTGGFRP